MKICVLDAISMSEAQVNRLRSLGEVSFYQELASSDSEILARASGCDIILLGWTKLSAEVMNQLPDLKMISLWATGTDYIDLPGATARNIVVTNVPGYAASAVAELSIGLALALYRNILGADRHVRSGDYDWKQFQGCQLEGKTIGIIGTGAIGSRVARLAHGFGMKVIAHTAHPSPERARLLGLEYLNLATLLRESDILSLHLSLTDSTRHLLGSSQLEMMKASSVLINTARADLVDQEALLLALQEHRILGAGLDDINWSLPSGKELLKLDQVVLTPHIGFNTREAIGIKTDICLDNVAHFMESRPDNVVNPAVLAK